MMTDKRREKKSESLEVRLPYSVKRAFMRATKRRGETASEAVRQFIDQYLEEAAQAETPSALSEITMTVTKNPRKTLAMALSAAAAAFTFAALPSAADDGVLALLDMNGDKVLTRSDFETMQGGDEAFEAIAEKADKNAGGQISEAEFATFESNAVVKKINIATDGSDVPANLTELGEHHIVTVGPMTGGDAKVSVETLEGATRVAIVKRKSEIVTSETAE